MRKVLLIVGGLLVVLVAAGGYYTIHQRSVGSKQTPAHSTTAATHTPSAQGTQFASAPPGATPIPSGFQLVISKIHVNATIEKVGLDKNGAMAVPVKPMDVGLYTAGPQPGAAQGDVVIDGHLDWYNLPRAVFYDLNKLQPGDQIDVVSNGKVLHYKVTDSATYPYTSHPVGLFSASGPPRLSLITCAGSWDAGKSVYSQRLVVNANYVGSN